MCTTAKYRVFRRKFVCFELVMWPEFWILGQVIKLFGVLSSGNLYQINNFGFFYLTQPRQPHIEKCQNSNSFFSKEGTKTTFFSNIRGPMCPKNPLLCLPNQFLSNQWCAPSMVQFGKKKFECNDWLCLPYFFHSKM